MRTLPIEMTIAGRDAAVVGADEVVASKLARLLQAGARVTLYTCGARPCAEVERLLAGPVATPVRVIWRAPLPLEWDRYVLVFASPNQPELCSALYAWALERGRPFCAIDRPEQCTFVNPAAFSAGGIRMRIFSGGISPGLSKKLRQHLQAALDTPTMRHFIDQLAALRARTTRSDRYRVMSAAVQDFRLEVCPCYPAWVERGLGPTDSISNRSS